MHLKMSSAKWLPFCLGVSVSSDGRFLSSPRVTFTNRSTDWSFGSHSIEYHHFPSLWLVEQFAHIFETNCSTDWPQICQIPSLWAIPGLINFCFSSAELPLFSGLWLVEQLSHISDNHSNDWPYTWSMQSSWKSTGLINCRRFLASDWPKSFCTSLDKPINRLTSNLMDAFLMGHPVSDKLLVTFIEFPQFQGLWQFRKFLLISRQTAH